MDEGLGNAIRLPAQSVIEARGLSHTYQLASGPVEALKDLSFKVLEGQFVSIVGPSGCGKSTLLQILGGLIDPSAGSVIVDGQPIAGPQARKISIVFQDATLLPWKTALENVRFPLEIQRYNRAVRDAKAMEMLELVGLADFSTTFPHQLSGGMKQRVSIARSLAQDPRIILMDEPFGALDEQTRTKMGQELLRIWSRTKKTVVLVTHSLTEAIYLSDVVLVMSQRPSVVIDTIEVDLPRPRNYEMIGSPTFGRIRNRIWREIGDDGDAEPKAMVGS